MSFVTASVFTILFALLDGEMQISVTAAGRVRLGILSYVVVVLTMWFSNQVTPVMLDYLDLGQPRLMRGACPVCGAAVSCLFTGAAQHRDERSCRVCGAVCRVQPPVEQAVPRVTAQVDCDAAAGLVGLLG